MRYQSVVCNGGQKMALRTPYVSIFQQISGHLWSKTLSAPSFGCYWKQLIGSAYSECLLSFLVLDFLMRGNPLKIINGPIVRLKVITQIPYDIISVQKVHNDIYFLHSCITCNFFPEWNIIVLLSLTAAGLLLVRQSQKWTLNDNFFV